MAEHMQAHFLSDTRLFVVGTPIGNLSDISQRALDTLSAVDVVLCEDTRVTAKLFSYFDIHTALERADAHILAKRLSALLSRMEDGIRFAYVSDAGMPSVSDPGQILVDAALDKGFRVEVIPGASASICALVASGFAMNHFFFEGFLPRKESAQRARLGELKQIPAALVIYESARRVLSTLAVIAEVFPQRRVALVRELTKVHEEVVRAAAGELYEKLKKRVETTNALKGECVLVIEPPTATECELSINPADLDDLILSALAAGESKTMIARRLAKAHRLSRSVIYDRIIELERV